MSLKYSIVPVPRSPGKYRAAVKRGPRVPYERFIEVIRGGTTLTEADIRATLVAAADWMVSCAASGDECDLGPLGGSRLGIKATFDGRPERVTHEDIEITLSWSLSPRIQGKLHLLAKKIPLQQVLPLSQEPVIVQVKALLPGSQWRLHAWQAGSMLQLNGDQLKFDPEQTDEGVFLSSPESGTLTRITSYHSVYPKSVLCIVPAELAGSGPLNVLVRRRPRPNFDPPLERRYARTLEEVAQ